MGFSTVGSLKLHTVIQSSWICYLSGQPKKRVVIKVMHVTQPASKITYRSAASVISEPRNDLFTCKTLIFRRTKSAHEHGSLLNLDYFQLWFSLRPRLDGRMPRVKVHRKFQQKAVLNRKRSCRAAFFPRRDVSWLVCVVAKLQRRRKRRARRFCSRSSNSNSASARNGNRI